jgi:hypothetical protein
MKVNTQRNRTNQRGVPVLLRYPSDRPSISRNRSRSCDSVSYRPVIGHGGACFYRIDGRLRVESEILLWAGPCRAESGPPEPDLEDRTAGMWWKRARRR